MTNTQQSSTMDKLRAFKVNSLQILFRILSEQQLLLFPLLTYQLMHIADHLQSSFIGTRNRNANHTAVHVHIWYLLLVCYRLDSGDFEPLEITPFSSPPDLPDVMKTDTNGQEQSSWTQNILLYSENVHSHRPVFLTTNTHQRQGIICV